MDKGTAIIIGVGPGLGFALAQTFATAGHPVALLARSADRLQGYVDEFMAAGHRAAAYAADAGDAAQLARAINTAADELGAPEVLVYNAAFLQRDAPTELNAADFAARLAVNVTGAKVATDAVLPLLKDGHGSLLYTGGGLALRPAPEYTSLSVGKAALRAYVQALFAAQAAKGVHAATVTIAGRIGADPGFEAERLAQIYLGLHQQRPEQWAAEVIHNAAAVGGPS